ncbi:ABC transporter permease [Parvularcula flava]|uniref:ABC transporter inner membrane subunit n=1 Tax=Aquisalinus luteolus TaxID=1566827 RepID=A0A8J3A6G9_9PROT|nr:ABC transporter permease [Aquisalinus luteolus]NHK27825.1 ABC transporter permease [Aquisalinus luteolus]GGH96621.1 ABC transporter inner membrane subunit [Aquisalinus luteolus]
MSVAAFELQETGDGWRLEAKGTWSLGAGLGDIDGKLRRFSDKTMSKSLKIDLSGVETMDTAGAMMLQRTMRACSQREEMAEDNALFGFEHVKEGYKSLLAAAANHLSPCEIDVKQGSAFVLMLERVGRGTEELMYEILRLVSYLGEVLVGLYTVLSRPKRLRMTSIVHHMEESGLNATLIVGLMSFLIGAVIAFMGATVLAQFGAQIFVVELIGITVLREFGVLLTAILIAGRSGSAFTAAIGSMKLREEVDAMEAMGIDPLEALVLPRLIAMVFVLPALTFIATMMGLIGGGLVAWLQMDISPAMFLTRTQDIIVVENFMVGMVKAPFFAFAISVIGCYQGMRVEGSAEELGRHTTISVVQSLFIVILLDAAFAIFFMELNI